MNVDLSRADIIRLYEETGTQRAKAGKGTPYECMQKDIDDYHKFAPQDGRPAYVAAETSVKGLTLFLTQQQPSSRVRRALSRLRAAVWNTVWGPDVIMKALHDIDTAIFRSRSRGQVVVNWTESSELAGRGHVMIPRGCCASRDGVATIFLNADQIFQSPRPFLQMWRTTVHELVHAYLHITCGSQARSSYDETRNFVPKHGWVFHWALNHAHARAMQYLDLPLLADNDVHLLDIDAEWRLIYEDSARLYSRKADSSHDQMRILEDIVRFRATPWYHEGRTLGNLPLTSRLTPRATRMPFPGQPPHGAGSAIGRHAGIR